MAKERVQKPIWQPSSQKKQSRIVPPLIDSQTEADSLLSPKVPVSNVKSKAERDAIRRSLFEKWAGRAPQPQSESEVLGHGGLSTATETIQGQEVSVAKDQMGMPIQAKLTIGKPGDKYEQEADRVAAQVVNQINAPTPPQPVQSQSVQREAIPKEEDELHLKLEADIIQREKMLESEEELQMKLQPSTGGMIATPDLETSIQQAKGGGLPLADNILKPMEQAFGADFSSVKVHTDRQSHQLNQSIQARAFTTGQHVFFRQGAYEPGSRNGQELLAHELTHVVQQNGSQLQRTQAAQATGQAFHAVTSLEPNRLIKGVSDSPGHRITASGVHQENKTNLPDNLKAGGVIQRYQQQNCPETNTSLISENNLYLLNEGDDLIYVRTDAPAPAYSQRTNVQVNALGATYNAYEPKDIFMVDCLHTAEEIMHDRRLRRGSVRSQVSATGEQFGDTNDGNWQAATNVPANQRNNNAAPGIREAYATVAENPVELEGGITCPFHAAAVVAQDGGDRITLEIFGDPDKTRRTGSAHYHVYNTDPQSNTTFHEKWKTTLGSTAVTISLQRR